MDFKKIARIFILAFTLLNIYLIVGIFERQDIQYTTAQPTSDNIFSNMEDLDIELPNLENEQTNTEEIYPLQVNAHNLLETELEAREELTGSLNEEGTVYYESFPSNPINLEGNPAEGFPEEDYILLENFVASDEVMFGSEYSFSHYNQESRYFVFYQYEDGIPIADGTSEILLYVNESGEIYAYEQTYAGEASRQGSPLQLIDASRAIEILFLNNEIRQGSEVQRPVLTYRRALHLEDLSMYSPVWLVNIDRASERNTFRVDAVNGTIIRQPVAPADTSEDNGSEEDTDATDEEPEDENTDEGQSE
ncbi:MAG TPA: two-component system regulatory protein YycI [Atopostipes sp.]|nr:two-component system regulatory protein YycI [Atopostipes sp.]